MSDAAGGSLCGCGGPGVDSADPLDHEPGCPLGDVRPGRSALERLRQLHRIVWANVESPTPELAEAMNEVADYLGVDKQYRWEGEP